ncbi:MAG TPA: DUF5671 domain-containing protein [Thermomicrobiaceae bacterium]|nr:DUF5671 domain-containing protein [Thermomicrobiaceae bacterium]
MVIARRLYLYFVAAASLAPLALGLVNLLRLALRWLWEALAGSQALPGASLGTRQQLSLYAALVLVALPIWLLHWWLAQRAARGAGPEAAGERGSLIRAFYLALVLLGSFVTWLVAAERLIEHLVLALLGPGSVAADSALPNALAILLVAGAIWAYHLRVALADLRAGELPAEAAALPRLYRYLAAFGGALLLLFGASALIHLLTDVLLPNRVLTTAPHWWLGRLANGVALTAAGLLAWGLHWGYAERLVRSGRQSWLAAAERASALRRLYLYAVLAVAVFATLLGLGRGLDALLRWALGAEPGLAAGPRAWELLDPLLGALPFALFWGYQRALLGREERVAAEDRRQAATRRLYGYLVALVGLALAAAGMALLLDVLIDLASGGRVGAPAGWWRGELSRDLALAAVGLAVWLWQWRAIQRRLARAPLAERAATVRRVYLYLVLAGALLSLLGSLAVVIYRVLSVILGVDAFHGLAGHLSQPLGIALVAAALTAYHLLLLRRDLSSQPSAPGPQRRALVLTAPPGTDLDALLASLRAGLPSGASLAELAGGSMQLADEAPGSEHAAPMA